MKKRLDKHVMVVYIVVNVIITAQQKEIRMLDLLKAICLVVGIWCVVFGLIFIFSYAIFIICK